MGDWPSCTHVFCTVLTCHPQMSSSPSSCYRLLSVKAGRHMCAVPSSYTDSRQRLSSSTLAKQAVAMRMAERPHPHPLMAPPDSPPSQAHAKDTHSPMDRWHRQHGHLIRWVVHPHRTRAPRWKLKRPGFQSLGQEWLGDQPVKGVLKCPSQISRAARAVQCTAQAWKGQIAS